MTQKERDENTIETRWAEVSSYGSRIRLAGESLEFCQAPIDEFEEELVAVEKAVNKIRELIKAIKRDL